MSTKSVITAVLLIALGIVFGVTIVSSFKGVDLSFAGEDVKLGAQTTQTKTNSTLKALNDAFHSIAKDVTPSVVYIQVKTKPKSDSREDGSGQFFFRFFGPDFKMPEPGPELGAGSGVILTPDGYVLTNNHVVDNADPDNIEVVLMDTRRFKATKVVGTDKYTDLAVIKIDAENLPVPRLGNSDDVEVGHIVFAFGNPLGLKSTMTQGIVSAIGRGQLGIINDREGYGIENFIQTDAAVNPGNSGGALVDIDGEVVGINTAIATTNQRFQGYSFAIPINLAKKVAADIIKYGKVMRGYLGVVISPVDATMAKANGMDKPQGVIINEVKAGGGKDAGLKEGDIILSVDGKEVNASNQLQTLIAAKHPGDEIALKIMRGRKVVEKKVTLRARDDEETVVAATDRKGRESSRKETTAPIKVKLEKIGLSVRDIDAEIKKQYEVEKGVYVEEVDPFSEAAQRGLSPRDVILSVGDTPIVSAAKFQEIIKSKKPGEAVLFRVKKQNNASVFVAIEIPK